MEHKFLQKIELYATILGHPIIVVIDMFGDGINHSFLVYNYTEYNPSNHVHKNSLSKCKCIDFILDSSLNFDEQSLITKIDEINYTSIEFSNNLAWIKVS